MHPNAQKALLDKIVAIAEQATNDVSESAFGGRSREVPEGEHIASGTKAAATFRTVVEDLAAERGWGDRFSVRYLDKRLGTILVAVHRHGRDEAAKLLTELVAEQQTFATEQRVFVPVTGLVLTVPELVVGQVAFREGTPAGVVAESEVGTYLAERVHAEFRAVAEPIKAGELGTNATRRALEALTFAHVASAGDGHFGDAVLSVESEKMAPAAWVGVVSPTHAYFEHRRTERSMPVLLSSDSLIALDAYGLRDVSELLIREKKDLSELEATILRAVHWLAVAQAQVEEDNRLLNLTTCLEALVGPLDNKADPISGTMAEAVALLLGSGYEERKRMRAFIITQYGARSGISHGRTTDVTAADVRRLRDLVVKLILKLLAVREVVTERKELFAWLERTRWGGPLASPGPARTIAELRAERGLSFMQLVDELGCRPEELDHWERSGPDLPALRRVANALDVPMERIVLPPHHLLMNHGGHRFLLGARRKAHRWIAKVKGWDPNDAEAWPCRPVDPRYPDILSPAVIATASWSFEADSARAALDGLRSQIDTAMERALTSTRLPDDPENWQPAKSAHV